MNATHINVLSLVLASSLVLVSLVFSYSQKLKLEKDILIGIVRAILQLLAVGYVLAFVFQLNNPLFTTLIVLFMALNAAWAAAKRGKGIPHVLLTSFLSICIGAGITLAVLVLSGSIQYLPNQIVPVSGMILSNAMVALGLCYQHMRTDFQSKREEVETRLALGADIFPSSIGIIRDAIRTGMLPTIDSAKTLGIVSLPGMMTGLILAGISPIQAVRYQILVTFMLLSTTAISSFAACYLSYRGFFNARKQLRE